MAGMSGGMPTSNPGAYGGGDPIQQILAMKGQDVAAMLGLPPQMAAMWDQMPPEAKMQLAQQVMTAPQAGGQASMAGGQGQTSMSPVDQMMAEQLAKGSGR